MRLQQVENTANFIYQSIPRCLKDDEDMTPLPFFRVESPASNSSLVRCLQQRVSRSARVGRNWAPERPERPKVCVGDNIDTNRHLGGSSQRSRPRARLWGLWGRAAGERAKRADMWSWMRFDVGGCRLDDGFLRMWVDFTNMTIFHKFPGILVTTAACCGGKEWFSGHEGQLTGCTWSASLRIK